MPKNVTKGTALSTVSVPAMSQSDIAARYAALLQGDPALAIAIASQALANAPSAKATRASTSVAGQETEAERANRCARFDDYSARGKIVAFAIGRLAEGNSIVLTENDIAEAIGLPVYKVRPALAIVEARLSDLHNPKFPLVPQIGYVASIEGERNEEKTLHFSRVASKGKATPRKATSKGKGNVAPAPVAPVAPVEGDSNAS